MRIDAEHCWDAERRTGEIWPILERNRFQGSVLFAPAGDQLVVEAQQNSFIKALIFRADQPESAIDQWRGEPLVRGLHCAATETVCGRLSDLQWTLESEPNNLPEIARRFPKLRVVARVIELDLNEAWWREALAAENLWLKPLMPPTFKGNATAAASLMRPLVQKCLGTLGPGRLLFASGWPDPTREVSWKERLAAFTQAIGPQSVAARELMLGGAAEAAYFPTLTSLK